LFLQRVEIGEKDSATKEYEVSANYCVDLMFGQSAGFYMAWMAQIRCIPRALKILEMEKGV
jgi:hypothetical protein